MLGTEQLLDQYRAMAAGSTVNNLNKDLVSNTSVNIPNKDEQIKVGMFLESFDHLITLHQRQQNSWKLIEKGVKLWMILTKNQILKRP